MGSAGYPVIPLGKYGAQKLLKAPRARMLVWERPEGPPGREGRQTRHVDCVAVKDDKYADCVFVENSLLK